MRSPLPACVGSALVAALVSCAPAAIACDSTACAVAMRYTDTALHPGQWRLDVSFRYVDQGRRLTGRDSTSTVVRPRIDLRQGAFEAASHEETSTAMTFVVLDVSRALGPAFTATAALPLYRRSASRSLHADGAPGVAASEGHGSAAFARENAAGGLGDLLLGGRWTALSRGPSELLVGLTVKLPTGASSRPGADGVVDPMLQPGTGAFDVAASLQYVARVSRTTFTATGSFQKAFMNGSGYRYSDDAVAAVSVSGPLSKRLIGQFQLKAQHAGRHQFHGMSVPSTGYTMVQLAQSLRVGVAPSVSLYGTLQLPAYIRVNESQLGPRLSLSAGFVKAF